MTSFFEFSQHKIAMELHLQKAIDSKRFREIGTALLMTQENARAWRLRSRQP